MQIRRTYDTVGARVIPEVDDVDVRLVNRAHHPLLRVDPLRHRTEDPRHLDSVAPGAERITQERE